MILSEKGFTLWEPYVDYVYVYANIKESSSAAPRHFGQESPEEWTPVEQEKPEVVVWESHDIHRFSLAFYCLQEIGRQLLEAYFNGQLEAG